VEFSLLSITDILGQRNFASAHNSGALRVGVALDFGKVKFAVNWTIHFLVGEAENGDSEMLEVG
jgi:hypothetical protein